jgi:hypothetical protein
MRKRLWMALAAVLMLVVPATALAAATDVITPGFSPNKKGKATHVTFKIVEGNSTPGAVPPPSTQTVVHLPKGLVINTKGFPTCSTATLMSAGGAACPAKSLVGTGSSTVTDQIGTTVINESATVKAYVGPPQGGNPTLNLYAVGTTPISAQIIIPGVLSKDTGKYGYKFTFTIPAITSVPGAPNASITTFTVNIGGAVKYHGKTVNLETLPKTCPKGGFNWGADFTYSDGEFVKTTATSKCAK